MIFHPVFGGGEKLQFRVVGGSTTPASAKENDIWVKTSTAISEWQLSPLTPSSPVENMVWIRTAQTADTSVDALDKNAIILYPAQAKQYVSGAWTTIDMKVYQNGSWVTVTSDAVIYSPENEATDITGGWYSTAASYVTNSGGMEVTNGYALTRYNIDMTGYSKMLVKLYNVSSKAGEVGVGNSNGTFVAKVSSGYSHTAYTYVEVPLDGVDGSYCVLIRALSTSGALKVSRVELIA